MNDYPPNQYRIEGRQFRRSLQRLHTHFFDDVKLQTGKHCYRGILWHAYSYGFQPALSGRAAIEAFKETAEDQLYTYHESFDYLWLCPRSIALSHTQPNEDWYIFPKSLDWLYVTTYEIVAGIGPFFASGR